MEKMSNVQINGLWLEESEVFIRRGIEERNIQQGIGGNIVDLGVIKHPATVRIEAYGEPEKTQIKALMHGGARQNLVCKGRVGRQEMILEEGYVTDWDNDAYKAEFQKTSESEI